MLPIQFTKAIPVKGTETSCSTFLLFLLLIVYKSYPRFGNGNFTEAFQYSVPVIVYKSYPRFGDGNADSHKHIERFFKRFTKAIPVKGTETIIDDTF